MILGILPEQGGSITNLSRSGQHTRFLDVYIDEYARAFDQVRYFSYLPESVALPPNCVVVPNPGLHRWVYAFALPVIQRALVGDCNVLRVMQAYGSIPALEAKLLYGTPFVLTWGYHYGQAEATKGAGALRTRLLDSRAALGARFADKVIVTTQAMAEYVGPRAREGAIALIPNGVETELFSPVGEGEAPPEDLFVVTSVGRLSAEKNLSLLIEAVARVQASGLGRRLRVQLIGSGPQREALAALADRLGVDVRFPGVVPNAQLPALLRCSHAFVLPSLGEGHPKALLEAMSCGLACVGTDVSGVRDVLTQGKTGLLCDLDAGAMADALRSVLTDREFARSLGAAARAETVAKYDLRRLVRQEIAMLKAVAAQNRPRVRP